jgi:nucleotide-binding universal stress UspA family protein
LEAVDAALEVAESSSSVHVIHVLPELVVLEPSVAWATIDDEDRIQATEKRLRAVLENEKYQGMEVKVLVGDPGHVIADYAQDVEADLIVLPSHGRTGLKRMLIGSVAERVVRLAHCPVLVIRK